MSNLSEGKEEGNSQIGILPTCEPRSEHELIIITILTVQEKRNGKVEEEEEHMNAVDA